MVLLLPSFVLSVALNLLNHSDIELGNGFLKRQNHTIYTFEISYFKPASDDTPSHHLQTLCQFNWFEWIIVFYTIQKHKPRTAYK